MSIEQILILPHLKIHNANGLSSPYTIGFPAVTGFLGAVHALQRKVNARGIAVSFDDVGIISHDANLQTYKGRNDFVHSIIGTGNPLEPKKEKGKPPENAVRPSFIEEARIHLEISLAVKFTGIELEQRDEFIDLVNQLLSRNMKIAGGDVLSHHNAQIHIVDTSEKESLQKLMRQLMPGYVLIERRDLMQEAMKEGLDALDSLIDYLVVHNNFEIISDNKTLEEKIKWVSKRKVTGWVIPIATGFQGISDLGQAKNQRDENAPHRFAESVVTLGEFKMSHRINNLDQLFWRYEFQEKNDLYLCQQAKSLNALPLNAWVDDQEYDEF
jgi:CRISPR-associated protein Csy2